MKHRYLKQASQDNSNGGSNVKIGSVVAEIWNTPVGWTIRRGSTLVVAASPWCDTKPCHFWHEWRQNIKIRKFTSDIWYVNFKKFFKSFFNEFSSHFWCKLFVSKRDEISCQWHRCVCNREHFTALPLPSPLWSKCELWKSYSSLKIGQVVSWIQLRMRWNIETGHEVEINALVPASHFRGRTCRILTYNMIKNGTISIENLEKMAEKRAFSTILNESADRSELARMVSLRCM